MEQLESLQIRTSEEGTNNEQTDTEMLTVLAPMEVIGRENSQAGLPKNIVSDLGWFDSD